MKIYNSLTRKKEDLVAIDEKKVGIYVCGPTVYDEPHIGHARSAYVFDVIRRYLKYKGYEVKFVRNVTDVDDKIINKAKDAAGRSPAANLTQAVIDISVKYLDSYRRDMDLLGIGRPDNEPKATEYIPKMIRFIEGLIAKGAAYAASGDVYFDIKKAKDYGKLSNQNIEKMEKGVRISPDERKRDVLDFALWKSAKEGEPYWDSPWGRGRPGWHIECSVMSSDILGNEFDIHGGGIDLIFPHHENEIAQSEGAGMGFARYWVHNGLVTIKGEKMAKSLGNFISIQDFINNFKDADYLKLLFLNTHYRHPVDYTEEKLDQVKAQKERFTIFFDKVDRLVKGPGRRGAPMPGKGGHVSGKGAHMGAPLLAEGSPEDVFRKAFEEAMDDDFNTPLALASLFDLVTHANKASQNKEELSVEEVEKLLAAKELIIDLAAVLGLDLSKDFTKEDVNEAVILNLIEERNAARTRKDFKAADEIRKKLLRELGIILEDGKEGTIWRRRG